MKKLCNSNCKTELLWLTLLLSGVITTAKKSSIQRIFSCQKKTEDKKIIERTKYGCFPCTLYRGRFKEEPGGNNIVDNH